jgi:phage protein D
MNRPRLVLTELREYRSDRTGATYFAGYLGKTRVVMLRAELTGREVARWSVLLEEPQPREERQAPTGSGDGERQVRPACEERRAAPPASTRSTGGRRQKAPAKTAERRNEKTAADRRAAESLRSRGIDPRSEIRQDDLGF